MKTELKKDPVPFTQVPNELINNQALDPLSRFIYVFMLSKPDGWNFTIKSMATQIGKGARTVGKAVQELKDAGWCQYTKLNDGKGVYRLYMSPSGNICTMQNLHPAKFASCKNGTLQNLRPISNKENISNTDLIKNKENIVQPEVGQQEKTETFFNSQSKRYFKDIKLVEVENFSENEKKYFKTAKAFYQVFEANLKENGSTTINLEKSRFKSFVDPIRLMYESDKITRAQMIVLHDFLKTDEFWKRNILSTNKLRVQVSQLLMKANSRPNGKINTNTENGQREYSDGFKRRLFAKLYPGKEYESTQGR